MTEPATTAARRWLNDLMVGPGLKAWGLMHEPLREALIDTWGHWCGEHGQNLVAALAAHPDARHGLLQHPDRVKPAPDVWLSLRDFVRMAYRPGLAPLREGLWGFVGDPRPVAVDRVAVIYARLPEDGRRGVVVKAVAIELVLTDAGWRVAGFSAPSAHQADRRLSSVY